MGLDAVVVPSSAAAPGALEVLLRHGVARSSPVRQAGEAIGLALSGVGGGILEPGDDLFQRAADEVMEEAGLRVPPASVEILGPPGLSHSRNVRRGVSVRLLRSGSGRAGASARRRRLALRGSARLEWLSLDEALGRCARGEIRDMKTEIGLRRLRELKAP